MTEFKQTWATNSKATNGHPSKAWFLRFWSYLLFAGALIAPANCYAASVSDFTSLVKSIIPLIDELAGKKELLETHGISQEDLDNLALGSLSPVIDRYAGLAKRSYAQQSILCDLYIKKNEFNRSNECLNALSNNFGLDEDKKQAIHARRALLELNQGNYPAAYSLAKGTDSKGLRYVNALSAIRLGKRNEAETIAKDFQKGKTAPDYYLAASIWHSLGKPKQVREILEDPRVHFLRSYGLSESKTFWGGTIQPALFRLDLFQEFEFGFFDSFSFAPQGNIYVEFLAASSYAKTGDTQEAAKRFEKVLEKATKGIYRDIRWVSLYERGKIYQSNGQLVDAEKAFEEAIDIIEKIRSTINSEQSRVGFLEDKFNVYRQMILLAIEKGDLQTALEYVDRSKSRAFIDVLANRRDFTLKQSDSQEGLLLLRDIQDLEALLSETDSNANPNEVTRLYARHRNLKARLREVAPSLSSLVTVQAFSYQDISNQLAANEAVLVYHKLEHAILGLCLHQGDITHHLIDATSMEDDIIYFRQDIQSPENDRYLELAYSLGERLLNPFERCLSSGSLTIVPDQFLHYLPFAALKTQSQFLGERTALRYLPSLQIMSLLGQTNSPRNEDRHTLVYGNPDRNDPQYNLPGAEREAIAIANALESSVLRLNDMASEEFIYNRGSEFDILHIASHGEFNLEMPLQSRLMLSKTQGYNGDLTVNDLYSLTLNANLVILSACETSLGKVNNGNDVIGLERGFFYAGTRGIIGTLWKISDESTVEIMVKLHENLHESRPDMALKNAILHGKENGYGHPYYWAAFKYTGALPHG